MRVEVAELHGEQDDAISAARVDQHVRADLRRVVGSQVRDARDAGHGTEVDLLDRVDRVEIDDQVTPEPIAEHEEIAAVVAEEPIVTLASDEQVVAGAPREGIVPSHPTSVSSPRPP